MRSSCLPGAASQNTATDGSPRSGQKNIARSATGYRLAPLTGCATAGTPNELFSELELREKNLAGS
jgi:hypothetical protein